MYFLTILIVIILILFLILAITILVNQCYYSFNSRRMVFFPTLLGQEIRAKLVEIVTKYAGKTEDKNLIEFGCGMGQTVHFLGNKFAWKTVLGIEVDNLTFLGARFYNSLQKQKINLEKTDILKYKMHGQNVVYCYLGPDLMSLLYNSGQFANCLVISLSFKIHECVALDKIVLKSSHGQLYVYDFLTK